MGGLLSNLALHAGTYYTYLQVLVLYSSTGVYSGAIVLRYYLFRGLQLRVEFKLCSFLVFVSGVRLCAYGERYAEDLILVLEYCMHNTVRTAASAKFPYHYHQILETPRSPSLFPLFGYRYRSRGTRRSTRTLPAWARIVLRKDSIVLSCLR